MQSLSLLSPAKLNLFLHITGKRADGYHNLQTLFQLLDWGDTLHFELISETGIQLCSQLDGVAPENNLIVRAARALQEHSGSKQGVAIEIEKQIPMGGGLGGGSSNAATTLLALNKLWQLDYSLEQLAQIGNRLGADVPVFVMGQNSLAEGTGEELYPISLPQHWFLVLKPSANVETATIFRAPRLTRDSLPIRIAAFFETGSQTLSSAGATALYTGVANSAIGKLKNDCENVVCELYPEVAEALHWLDMQPMARNAMLTGTGACVFARFDGEQTALDTLTRLPDRWQGFVALASTRSKVHRELYP